ncbi:RHS repeat domain-containing protein [Xanthomonas bundabergensis]|uniref:RHS repeat domain-containing protein n=1 Tax=Xanthomonas bundabergensis TaxID=3160842 RepID=UPI003513A4F1
MKGSAKLLTKLLWLLALAVPLHAAAETVEYFHTDALGTQIAVTDATGNLIETSEYEPYGKLLNRPVTDGPGFTGHVQDAATGLTYMQQRYYDPVIGRFLSVDPVAANANTVANFNRYKYATNNPYKFMDPDGRSDVNYFYGGNFMGVGEDPLYSAAERFDIPGFTTVMGHSWDRGYRDDGVAIKGPEVSYNSLRNDMAQNYKKGEYIFLAVVIWDLDLCLELWLEILIQRCLRVMVMSGGVRIRGGYNLHCEFQEGWHGLQ